MDLHEKYLLKTNVGSSDELTVSLILIGFDVSIETSWNRASVSPLLVNASEPSISGTTTDCEEDAEKEEEEEGETVDVEPATEEEG